VDLGRLEFLSQDQRLKLLIGHARNLFLSLHAGSERSRAGKGTTGDHLATGNHRLTLLCLTREGLACSQDGLPSPSDPNCSGVWTDLEICLTQPLTAPTPGVVPGQNRWSRQICDHVSNVSRCRTSSAGSANPVSIIDSSRGRTL